VGTTPVGEVSSSRMDWKVDVTNSRVRGSVGSLARDGRGAEAVVVRRKDVVAMVLVRKSRRGEDDDDGEDVSKDGSVDDVDGPMFTLSWLSCDWRGLKEEDENGELLTVTKPWATKGA